MNCVAVVEVIEDAALPFSNGLDFRNPLAKFVVGIEIVTVLSTFYLARHQNDVANI
jgi:hypothetical protein